MWSQEKIFFFMVRDNRVSLYDGITVTEWGKLLQE